MIKKDLENIFNKLNDLYNVTIEKGIPVQMKKNNAINLINEIVAMLTTIMNKQTVLYAKKYKIFTTKKVHKIIIVFSEN